MTRARDIADGLGAESGEVVPHIKLDILYPAVAGKLLDGSTSHSGNYGTAQSDGRSYFYTDIKDSKPIKDPRIGAYFGSQRHMFTSLQILDQETATHGSNVFSIDGREWIKAVDSEGTWVAQNNSAGNYIEASGGNCQGNFIEITGYFNDINFSFYTHSNRCDDIDISVNGTLSVDGSTTLGGKTTVESPLGGRYVNASSFINGGSTLSTSLGTTPKINTIRYEAKTGSSEYISINGIDLIAQDTTSTANKSKIQIPSQNVVSYGKKFTVSGTPHYDPFNGFTSGNLAAVQALIDTDTSLGIANWLHSGSYYRPYNGGRVVIWCDSSGNLKTSVTMMPPNAQNLHRVASAEVSNAHIQAGTNDDVINFNTASIDNNQLSELAKTWYWREFGNGAANGGAGAGTTLADFSMVTASSDMCCHVMEDGLTSLVGHSAYHDTGANGLLQAANGGYWSFTFIGTGVGVEIMTGTTSATTDDDYDMYIDGVKIEDVVTSSSANWYNKVNSSTVYAQNLPYGTHILRSNRVAADAWNLTVRAFDVHQPKMPPIPEDACIIADYMLMANFVAQGDGTDNASAYKISKGTRQVQVTKDIKMHDADNATWTFDLQEAAVGGYNIYGSNGADGADTLTFRLPAFGTNWVHRGFDSDERVKLYLDTTDKDSAATKNGDAVYGSYAYLATALEPGAYKFGANAVTGQNGATSAFEIVTPIHTSHHYRTFETPFLRHMIGGDRNVEQTHLICSADGKSWDEITRDTSYIGNTVAAFSRTNSTPSSSGAQWIIDEVRGTHDNCKYLFQKDWTVGYNVVYCLVEGWYQIDWQLHMSTGHCDMYRNESFLHRLHSFTGNANASVTISQYFKKWDYLKVVGGYSGGSSDHRYHNLQITRLTDLNKSTDRNWQ